MSDSADQLWEDAFSKFDADGSGHIDKNELKKAMKQLGQPITEAQAQAMMDEADADGSGEIDFMEFRKLVAKKSKSKLWYGAATEAAMESAIKIQANVRDFTLKMMNFTLKNMNFILRMMDFTLKMLNFIGAEAEGC